MRRGATVPQPEPSPPSQYGHPGLIDLFGALPFAVLVIDGRDRIAHANAQAEAMLNLSETMMVGQSVGAILPPLGEGERRRGHDLAVLDAHLVTRRGVQIHADVMETDVPDHPGWRMMTFQPASPSRRLGHAVERGAGGRSVVGAATMLAHEIRNPLSGIRGAAQLIGEGELPALIVSEVDRIARLIDRMQAFDDTRPLELTAQSIYPLLMHARSVVAAGFADNIVIEERFDPSLPGASINHDALLQVLINVLKNACEAVQALPAPRILLTTAYRHGMAASVSPGEPRRLLPIEICVVDNGPGANSELAPHLFDPFVSGRPDGQGLGLALVDKLMRDMGGVAEYAREGDPEMTVLRLMLRRAAP